MKLEIFGGTKETEDVLRLKLEYSDKDIRLVAVDSNGKKLHDGVILTINMDGTLYRNCAINKNIPVKKMSDGRIVEACA